MNKKHQSNLALLFIILFSFVFTNCEHIDEMNGAKNKKTNLDIPVNFIKLADDSTNVAGFVEVSSSASELDIKWNIPPECNIDTTQTVFETSNGNCRIPIKWIEKNEEGLHGPITKAFDGGLLVSAGELSQYVHLIWADEVDSIQMASQKITMTRSVAVLPRAVMIDLTPETVDMDKELGGGIYVNFTDAPTVYVDRSRIPTSTRIDKSKIDMFLNAPGPIMLTWIDDTAPNANFSTQLRFTAGDITKIGYINYIVQQETPAIWEFIDSTPSEGNTVLANEANIIVQVKTNKPWSLECEQGLTSPVSDFGTAYDTRSLVMPLLNNTTPDQREIKVLVKSQGVLQKTLIFNQMGQGQTGIFDFLSSDPVDKSALPGEITSVDVTVQSDVAWWIKCDCGKRMDYPASALGEKTGTVTITENTTGVPRVVTVTVGYGDKVVKTLNFVQNVSGGVGPNATLVYDSSTLPTGNIPQGGGTYTFTFTGTYTGEVQIRALIDGVAQTPGTSVTNKQPQVSVLANTLATTRNITFQYKRADGDWTALPTSTNRVQDGTNGGGETPGGNITPGKILPPGDVPEGGRSYFCQFKGTGSVFFRALRNGTEVSRSPEGTATPTGVNLSVTIPPLGDTPSSTISFEYSIDGGNTWINMNDNRTQNQTYVVVDTPVIKELPAKNASASFGIRGTSQEAVTIGAYVGRVLIGSATAYPTPEGLTLKVPVDDNPGPNYRLVSFSWTLDGENWGSTPPVKQLAP